MTSRSLLVVCTLLVMVMASMSGPASHAGPPGTPAVMRIVCVHCSATDHLSSCGLFLHRSGVRRHIRASKACFAAGLGFIKEIHVEARPGDVTAGAGGAAGPAPDARHQPPGKIVIVYCNYCTVQNDAASTVVKAAGCYAGGLGFEFSPMQFFAFLGFVYRHMNWNMLCMYLVYTLHEQDLNKYVHKLILFSYVLVCTWSVQGTTMPVQDIYFSVHGLSWFILFHTMNLVFP
jgi:hypothetical protein